VSKGNPKPITVQFYITYRFVSNSHFNQTHFNIPETRPANSSRCLRFYYYHCVYTSAGGLLFLEGSIYPVVSVSALTWLIRYIYIYFFRS
jgi:hypothetical protein